MKDTLLHGGAGSPAAVIAVAPVSFAPLLTTKVAKVERLPPPGGGAPGVSRMPLALPPPTVPATVTLAFDE